MRLGGKRALITGTGQGLGEQMAFALAREGCEIVGFEIRPELLETTTQALRALGHQASGRVVDVSDHEAVREAVAAGMQNLALLTSSSTTPARVSGKPSPS